MIHVGCVSLPALSFKHIVIGVCVRYFIAVTSNKGVTGQTGSRLRDVARRYEVDLVEAVPAFPGSPGKLFVLLLFLALLMDHIKFRWSKPKN